MPIKVQMTGREDVESPWKYAICGYPGAGKTLVASTAPDPLFVFFQENPRLKSIADRYIPHVKVVNDDDGTVLEKMLAISHHLAIAEHEYKTLVIDTGDELFQQMKEARRMQNDGEFKPGDWDWIGDTYRELLTGLIDLPLRVIVLFHVKNVQEGDDGMMTREFLLQGTAKDQAAGWFDEVFMFDNFEAVDDEGETISKRGLLTQSSRLHPWLKDHSGNMPRRYEVSENFVGDFEVIEKILNKEVKGGKEDLEEIASYEAEKTESDESAPVPTPEEVKAKKEEVVPDDADVTPPPEEKTPIEKASDTVKEVLDATEVDEKEAAPEPEGEDKEEEAPAITVPDPEEDEPSDEDSTPKCDECGDPVENDDLINMSRAKYKQVLCRVHFKDRMRSGTN